MRAEPAVLLAGLEVLLPRNCFDAIASTLLDVCSFLPIILLLYDNYATGLEGVNRYELVAKLK